MSKPKVIILGSTGMLGWIVLDSFVSSGDFDLVATYRNEDEAKPLEQAYQAVEFRRLDAEKTTVAELVKVLEGVEWVVNAIGVIKPYIHDDNPDEVTRAIRVNALFPHLLGEAAGSVGAKVVQIATDCVYSGEKGGYIETDLHDALDVYGKTKSLGESYQGGVYNIRCSIIGPERKGHLSLMDWFLGQENGAELNGFTNHQWNGVTTLQFARLCQGVIKNNISLSHIQHVVPTSLISKYDLLKTFAKEFGRTDITINATEAPKVIDRTLSTQDTGLNLQMWKAAGYDQPPTVEEMVAELASYEPTLKETI